MAEKKFSVDLPTVLLALYIVYAIFSIGMTGLLFSVAVGLVLYGLVDSYAVLCGSVIFSGILWKVVLSKYFKFNEGFSAPVDEIKNTNFNPANIIGRIKSVERKQEPTGFLSSSFVEGFADAIPDDSDSSSKPNAGSETNKKDDSKAVASTTSAPASVNTPSATQQLANALPTEAATNGKGASTPEVQTFKNGPDGLFKLGSLPSEATGGFHIDAGTTLLGALNSLKPEQVEAMTNDTRALLNTQKSLMGMLQSMKPMMNDGKELLSTFQDMFGGQLK